MPYGQTPSADGLEEKGRLHEQRRTMSGYQATQAVEIQKKDSVKIPAILVKEVFS